jgi:hypothetical protein
VVWCTEPPKLQTFGGDTTFVRRSRRLQIQWFWDNLQRKNKWPQPTALRKLTSTRAEDVVCTFLLHYTNDSFEVQKDWTLKETSTLGVKWCQCHTAMVDCLTTEGKHVSGHMWKGRLLVMDGLNLFFIMISVITYQQPFWLQLRYHRKRKEKKRKEKKRKERVLTVLNDDNSFVRTAVEIIIWNCNCMTSQFPSDNGVSCWWRNVLCCVLQATLSGNSESVEL